MKPMAALSFAFTTLVCLSLTSMPLDASAQEKHAAKLSVRLVIYDGAAPAYYPLADDGSGMGAVIKNFKRLPPSPWKSYAQIETLTLLLVRDGSRARVSVFIPNETEGYPESGKVAECLLDEGGECVMTQLLVRGVEPFRVGVVRRVETKLAPPQVVNRTLGVEVTSVEVREAGPSFELTLHNASGKEIRAVEIEERRGWESKGSPPRYEWKKMELIKPDEAWKVLIEFGWNLKSEQGGHAVEPPDRIIIKSVLFSDGSYEGETSFAARAEALKTGRRAQLTRVLEILREYGDQPGADVRETAREIALKVAMLECTADWTSVAELAGRFNLSSGRVFDDIKSSMEEGMELQRAAVLGHLKDLNASVPADANGRAFHGWLKKWREAYEKMLARI